MTIAQATWEQPQVIAKLSFADLVNPIQTSVNIALEHHWKGRWYWHHQTAYLFKSPYKSDFPDQTGFRLRNGLRLYNKRSIGLDEKVFLELNVGYVKSKILLEDDFCRAGCYYMQRINYERPQEVYTATIEWGTANQVSSHWLVEFAVGGGVQFGNAHYRKIPPDATLIGQGFTFFSYQENPSVSLITFGLRLKVGYILK